MCDPVFTDISCTYIYIYIFVNLYKQCCLVVHVVGKMYRICYTPKHMFSTYMTETINIEEPVNVSLIQTEIKCTSKLVLPLFIIASTTSRKRYTSTLKFNRNTVNPKTAEA